MKILKYAIMFMTLFTGCAMSQTLSEVSNGEPMSSVRGKINTLIGTYNAGWPNHLANTTNAHGIDSKLSTSTFNVYTSSVAPTIASVQANTQTWSTVTGKVDVTTFNEFTVYVDSLVFGGETNQLWATVTGKVDTTTFNVYTSSVAPAIASVQANTQTWSTVTGKVDVTTFNVYTSSVASIISSNMYMGGGIAGVQHINVYPTTNAIENGTALLTAYETAKSKGPSASNEITIILYPGKYNIQTNALNLNTSYINIMGAVPCKLTTIGTNTSAVRTSDTPSVGIYSSGSILTCQTNINTSISHLQIFSSVAANSSNAVWNNILFSGSVGGDSETRGTYIDCIFDNGLSHSIQFNGTLERCVAPNGFASQANVFGTFIGCTIIGDLSIGGFAQGSGVYTVSGTFKDCTMEGLGVVGFQNIVLGTFINCTITGGSAVGGGEAGRVDGKFINCTITGDYAVGGGVGGTVSGTFTDCVITGDGAVGGSGTVTSNAKFKGCTISGFDVVGTRGLVAGTFTDCVITGDYAVGGDSGSVSGTFTDCTISGRGVVGGGGQVSGTFKGCKISGDNALGSIAGIAGIGYATNCVVGGSFYNCEIDSHFGFYGASMGDLMMYYSRVFGEEILGGVVSTNMYRHSEFLFSFGLPGSLTNLTNIAIFNCLDGSLMPLPNRTW